jgi:predicted metal-dependent HD superfamily phosphohydrolase
VFERWKKLALDFTSDQKLINNLFDEIFKAYTSPQRHYHSLNHIHRLLQLSDEHNGKLSRKDIVDFSIFYHDIVYNTTRSDNESQSAKLAADRLRLMKLPAETIDDVVQFIEATKTHELSTVSKQKDLAYFLDFDMFVLGSDWKEYQHYVENISKEYAHFPRGAFKQGRKSFIIQTLNSTQIFHTDEFKELYEVKARMNLQRELEKIWD